MSKTRVKQEIARLRAMAKALRKQAANLDASAVKIERQLAQMEVQHVD